MHKFFFVNVDLLEARVLFAAAPPLNHAVHVRPLHPVDAVVAATLGNARLLDAWSPLGGLKAPNASAKSYLDLDAYTPFDVNFGALHRALAVAPTRAAFAQGTSQAFTIALPTPDGSYARFKVVQSDTLGTQLAKKYTGIKTFVGQGIDDSTATLAMDYTSLGLHASVRGAGGDYNI